MGVATGSGVWPPDTPLRVLFTDQATTLIAYGLNSNGLRDAPKLAKYRVLRDAFSPFRPGRLRESSHGHRGRTGGDRQDTLPPWNRRHDL
jgi:hypothetical protein